MNEENIIYRVPAEISPDRAAELYVEAGWMDRPDGAAVRAMLKGTFAVSAAFNEAGELIGFMRALSDGVSDAYLLDLVVTEPYRHRGIARKIYDGLAQYLASCGVDWIMMIGAPGTEKVYAKSRWRPLADHTPYRYE